MLNFLENMLVSILCFPGMRGAEMKKLFLKHHNHMCVGCNIDFSGCMIKPNGRSISIVSFTFFKQLS